MKDERLQRLTHFVGEVRDRVEEIESEISEVETALGEIDSIIEAERAHSETAETHDARDQLSTGDTHEMVIEESPGVDGPDAMARIDGIITFVAPQDFDIKAGDTVRGKLTDVGETHARAVATDVID